MDRSFIFMEVKSIYDKYYSGELSAEEALRLLCADFTRLHISIEPLEAAQKAVRSDMTLLLENAFNGGRVAVEGFGELRITEPITITAYGRKELDELVMELLEERQFGMAAKIQACRKETCRVGSLRIELLKK
jgi:hypothetical protein